MISYIAGIGFGDLGYDIHYLFVIYRWYQSSKCDNYSQQKQRNEISFFRHVFLPSIAYYLFGSDFFGFFFHHW
jgi:hypothetical protein